jgi:hypothetical protein
LLLGLHLPMLLRLHLPVLLRLQPPFLLLQLHLPLLLRLQLPLLLLQLHLPLLLRILLACQHFFAGSGMGGEVRSIMEEPVAYSRHTDICFSSQLQKAEKGRRLVWWIHCQTRSP